MSNNNDDSYKKQGIVRQIARALREALKREQYSREEVGYSGDRQERRDIRRKKRGDSDEYDE